MTYSLLLSERHYIFSLINVMKRLQKLKTWVCSGEPLVTSLAQQFLDHFRDQDVTLCNFYGSTEVMGDVTFHIIRSSKDLKYDKVPIGEFSVDKFYHIIHKTTSGFLGILDCIM